MAAGAALSACAVGPDYHRPPVTTPPAFKETKGWTPAAPADGVDRGDWWTLFGDDQLNALEARVLVSNQNLKAAEAAYRQARALVAEDRASLFPAVDLTGSATRSQRGGTSTAIGPGGAVTTVRSPAASSYQASLGASWEPDIWGKIRRTVESAKGSAQASEADLANARLSAQSELAADYVQLRLADANKRLLTATVDGYAKSLQITQNQYKVGVAAKSDVLQARTQLVSTQAQLVDLDNQRAAAEHAIAVLIGEAPADFTLAPATDWTPKPPPTPESLPSTLLQRRPDVAAAERRAMAANAQIGVATAGFFPDITLSGSYGFGSSALKSLFNSSNAAWSYGGNLAQTVFDAGATLERVHGARAGYDQAVATYRQTVLSAFQQVEDGLAAARVLQDEAVYRQEASSSADQAEQILLNQYRAGQVAYTSVVVAQATALSARESLLQIQGQRITNSISLIAALGGGWDGKLK
ncbi:efflux transporter outer membrane subunit [Phenylobacterium montanum]|uniref:Efflux transporter outer membrane subunit n=2 Tax=Phenylobacterium montanum TaxID=2823693 RepID=A0A975G5A8_9CAUL|nr:efflux transporter outer membrane subunit [Caulobacter sp. S6]